MGAECQVGYWCDVFATLSVIFCLLNFVCLFIHSFAEVGS